MLGLLGLRARDIMGVTFAIFLVLVPVVLVLVTVLGGDVGVSAVVDPPIASGLIA